MKSKLFVLLMCILTGGFVSCIEDDYIYDRESPEWLGDNIYDYLKSDGHYTYFVRLVEDCGLQDVLKRTGSKTLFVARDDAFDRFFASPNVYGVRSYDEFTLAMKNSIMKCAMLDNAFLIETITMAPGAPNTNPAGAAMRRSTSIEIFDSVPYYKGNKIPDNKFWQRFKDKGIYLLEDDNVPGVLHFFDKNMIIKGVTAEDFRVLTNGRERTSDVAFVFDNKILSNVVDGGKMVQINRDITCKNGYIHVLENVLVPRSNMAQYINRSQDATAFSEIMERFSYPEGYSSTSKYWGTHPGFTDSLYVKRYILDGGKDPNNVTYDQALRFDPCKNSLQTTNKKFEEDIPVMFVPTDQAMNEYINNGDGRFLKEAYGSWKNLPNEVAALFLRNHMKTSLLNSLPSKFGFLTDDDSYKMDISQENIESVYMANNGVIYRTNKVFPPISYSSVLAPLLVKENLKIFNWAIATYKYNLYLQAMEDNITFSLMVPSDELMCDYIDPVAQGHAIPERWKFKYDIKKKAVRAVKYSMLTGDSIGEVNHPNQILQNRFEDILDSHIVVGDIGSGRKYYLTKGGGTIEVSGNGVGMQIRGGGQIERNGVCKVTDIYTNKNGKTYILDSQIQDPFMSVYKILSTTPNFSKFFELCDEAGRYGYSFFENPDKYSALTSGDYNVTFFSKFHYTIYVPTNDALEKAIREGLIPAWDQVKAAQDAGNDELQAKLTDKIVRFLKYHFQDNSIYIKGPQVNMQYQTATLNKQTNKFYRLGVISTDNSITLKPLVGEDTHVITSHGLYNIMARDYSIVGQNSTATMIATSSRTVIHQIDKVLRFE